MRWVLGILGGYLALTLALIVAYPSVAHAARRLQYEVGDGRGHRLTVSRDLPLPFVSPTETVQVFGRHGDLLDEEVFHGAQWVGVGDWSEYNVRVHVYRNGLPGGPRTQVSLVTLNLEQ